MKGSQCKCLSESRSSKNINVCLSVCYETKSCTYRSMCECDLIGCFGVSTVLKIVSLYEHLISISLLIACVFLYQHLHIVSRSSKIFSLSWCVRAHVH